MTIDHSNGDEAETYAFQAMNHKKEAKVETGLKIDLSILNQDDSIEDSSDSASNEHNDPFQKSEKGSINQDKINSKSLTGQGIGKN